MEAQQDGSAGVAKAALVDPHLHPPLFEKPPAEKVPTLSSLIQNTKLLFILNCFIIWATFSTGRADLVVRPQLRGRRSPGCIFTNPTLIELRQEIGQNDWLASPRADDVVLSSRASAFH
ncbi:hypothetical protein AVEN_239855-1 [Araneus ventricosus]|uniref:Uncharacterized protein n=1 Tax=Araneus ventricosus TaxID=182803 RepID=A0A4Y2FBE7_ARAVE|nr:hypothetical protein AVEN_239855-1 [Araneus ventricosus]